MGYSIVGHARILGLSEDGVRCLAIIDAAAMRDHDALCPVPRREQGASRSPRQLRRLFSGVQGFVNDELRTYWLSDEGGTKLLSGLAWCFAGIARIMPTMMTGKDCIC